LNGLTVVLISDMEFPLVKELGVKT
jgi:hypothetical protein